LLCGSESELAKGEEGIEMSGNKKLEFAVFLEVIA